MKNIILITIIFITSISNIATTLASKKIIYLDVIEKDKNKFADDVEITLYNNGVVENKRNYKKGKTLSFSIKPDKNYQIIASKKLYSDEIINLSTLKNIPAKKFPLKITISISEKPENLTFVGKIIDRNSQKPLKETLIKVLNTMTYEQNYTMTDENGSYKIDLKSGYNYEVQTVNADYLKRYGVIKYCKKYLDDDKKYCFSGFQDVAFDDDGNVSATTKMDKIEIGKTFKIDKIYYDYNQHFIRSDAAVQLNKLVDILIDNPQIQIELGSHADSRGKDEYNLELSQKRASSAVDYVVSKGVNKNRITAKGYGETQLINHCKNGVHCPEELHEENRRTEFKIVEIDRSIIPQIRKIIFSTIKNNKKK